MKLQKALKSRTVWTIIVMFVIGGIQNISQFIPANVMPVVQSVLGLLVVYFKLNPSQDY